MRLVFMGSPPFAVPVLERILASTHRVTALVTRPDRPQGRGRKIEASPLVESARRASVEILQPNSARDPEFVAALRAVAPDVLLVASYGEILKSDVLELAPHGALNVHASLLPRHRGASPIQAAILAGDRVTGVSVQRMVLALDEGDVLIADETKITDDENAGELLQRHARLGGDAAVRALDLIERGDARFVPQDARLATYAKKIGKDTGWIDWAKPSAEISRFVRAMTPWPGARTTIPGGGEIVVLKLRASVLPLAHVPGAHVPGAHVPGAHAPGALLDTRGAPCVATGDSALEIVRVKPSGKAEMDGAAWLRGVRIPSGAVLGIR
jgi:methionyl-tRNA formyltransferase